MSASFVQVSRGGDWADGAVLLSARRAFFSGGEHTWTHGSWPGAGGTAQRRAASKYLRHTHTCTHFVQIGQDTSCLIARCSWYHIASGLRSFSNVSVMQDRLAQQQKSMVEERAYLKEIISRMDTQLNEQQRQLEKVRVNQPSEVDYL